MEKWRAVERKATVKVHPTLSSSHAPQFGSGRLQKGVWRTGRAGRAAGL